MKKLQLTFFALLTAICAAAQTVDPADVQLFKPAGYATDRDNIRDNSFRSLRYLDANGQIQSSSTLFCWNANGSVGTFQLETFFLGDLKFRNSVDNGPGWTSWKTIWTSANLNPANYMAAAVNAWNKDVADNNRVFFQTVNNTPGSTFIRGYGATPLQIRNGNDVTVLQLGQNGELGVGVTDTKGYKLAVGGSMIAEKIKVKLQSAWPDYVFQQDYPLPSLAELEHYIHKHSHLPDMPDAQTVAEDGLDLGEMNKKLLQKVEELTLYIIQQNKEMEAVKQRLNTLEKTPTP